MNSHEQSFRNAAEICFPWRTGLGRILCCWARLARRHQEFWDHGKSCEDGQESKSGNGMIFQIVWLNQGKKLSGAGGNVRGQHSSNPAGKNVTLSESGCRECWDLFHSLHSTGFSLRCHVPARNISVSNLKSLRFSAWRWEWINEGGDLILWK